MQTPEDQIRRSNQTSAADLLSTETDFLLRNDSTSSAMRCLLQDSQESPITHVSPSPSSVLGSSSEQSDDTPQLDDSQCDESQCDESQCDDSKRKDSERKDSKRKDSERKDSERKDSERKDSEDSELNDSERKDSEHETTQSDSQQRDDSPAPVAHNECENLDDSPAPASMMSSSFSSQAKECRDQTSSDTIEHDEHVASVLLEAKHSRVLLQPRTRRPTLWQHALDPRTALCCTKGVDDGVRLAATGLIWEVDDEQYEIITTATLGWKKGKNRSHKIQPQGPHYAFVRKTCYIGGSVFFKQLLKIHILYLFQHGTPAALVNKTVLAREKVFVKNFLYRFDTSVQKWQNVKLLKEAASSCDKDKPQPSFSKPVKRSRRLRELENKQLHADLRRRQQNEAKALAEAKRKAARLERQTHHRKLVKEVKDAVEIEVSKIAKTSKKENAVRNKQLDTFKKKTQTDVEDLCGRLDHLQEETYRLAALLSELDKHKKTMSKKFKVVTDRIDDVRLEQANLGAMHANLSATVKAKTAEKPPKKPKKKRRKVKFEKKQMNNPLQQPQVAPAPPAPQPQPDTQKFWSNVENVPVVQRQPPPQPQLFATGQPQHFVREPNPSQPFVRFDTPRPTSHGHYVSPVFASRNYAR